MTSRRIVIGAWVVGVLFFFTLVLLAAWSLNRSQEAPFSSQIDHSIQAVKKILQVALNGEYWTGKVFHGGVVVRYKKDAIWYVAPDDHIECLTMIAKRYTPSRVLAKNLPHA